MQSHSDGGPAAIRFSKLKTILSNVGHYKSLIRCSSLDAQGLLDAFQSFLNNPELDIAFKGELLVAAQRLSKKAGLYPVCFQLKDSVTQISNEMVASGGFGDIYQGTLHGEVICIKVLRVYAALDVEHALKELYKEAILWGHLLHPNLLTFYGIYRFGNRPCLVAPWMSHGDINNYLRNNPKALRIYLVDDVAHGLKYLHESGIVHGDLKGPNILIDNAGRARLADFGISSISDPLIVAWTSCSSAASRGGSIRWQAPELFDMENDEAVENSVASDVYAWGCVCYEIFTGVVPFFHLNRDAAVMYQAKQGTRPTQPPTDSPSWREWGLTNPIWTLMQECWKEAPLERPTILEAIDRLRVDRSQDKRPRATILSPIYFRETVAEPLDGAAMSTLDRVLDTILGADIPSFDQNSIQVTERKMQETALDIQASPDGGRYRSRSPELFQSQFGSSPHTHPSLATPMSPTEDSSLMLNLDEDQGQPLLFRSPKGKSVTSPTITQLTLDLSHVDLRTTEDTVIQSASPSTPAETLVGPEPASLPLTELPVPDTSKPKPAIVPPLKESANLATADSGQEGEANEDISATPGKQNDWRGKQGKKKNVSVTITESEVEGVDEKRSANRSTDNTVGKGPERPPLSYFPPVASPLVVSDTILGFGSHGTVVFQGSFQGRAVAVKRFLQDFVATASREASILQESGDHPNIIQYYYQEADANFLYMVLELCPASLADIVENPDRDQWRDIAIAFDIKKALKEITSGLRHLHALQLVHLDINPQNILVSGTKSTLGRKTMYRMLISNFGSCKRLDVDPTDFLSTEPGAMAVGTSGWRAPEILRVGKLNDLSANHSMSSWGSASTDRGVSSTARLTRLTKSVDIFALGCLFYYTMTNGSHPYGDRFEREMNISKNQKDLEELQRFGDSEGVEAANLITRMLDPEAYERPDITACLLHPFFWDPAQRLNFLQDTSERFEIMCKNPRDPYLLVLENDALAIVGDNWYSRLDKIFIENLGEFRKYDGHSVQDLLRALQYKKYHYQDLSDNVKGHLGPIPEGSLAYITKRFPGLFLHVYSVVSSTGLRTESMFRAYFELPE